jgi:hypothetical protein
MMFLRINLIYKIHKHYNKFNGKLFTKVIKTPSKEAWVWIDEVSNKREAHVL